MMPNLVSPLQRWFSSTVRKDADNFAPGGHPVSHWQGDDDVVITLTATNRVNKS